MIKNSLQEKRIFKVIILAVVLLIPVIYSFFYLKSYWDPYGNLKDIKVAIVNLDKGNRGKELIESMQKSDNTLGFTEASSEDALNGLANDEYYAVITIPEDFTRYLESVGETNKHKAVITYTPNKRKNYLASQIINSGLKTAEIELQAKVASITVGTMSNKLKETPENLDRVIDGVSRIEDGSKALESGLTELSEGTNTLDTRYAEFDAGVKSASEGSKKLTSGLVKASDGVNIIAKGSSDLDNGVVQINEALDKANTSKITDLTDGISALNEGVNGTSGLVNGIKSYTAGVQTYADTIEAGANQLQTGLDSYIAGQNQLKTNKNAILQALASNYAKSEDPTLAGLAGKASQLLSAEPDLSGSETALKNGISQIANAKKGEGYNKLTAGETALKQGAGKISAGVTQLNNSTEQIQSLGNSISVLRFNLGQVQDGTSKLKNGAQELQLGISKIDNGTNTLSNGLNTLSTNSSLIKTSLEKLDNGAKSSLNGNKKLTDGIEELKTSVQNGKDVAEGQLETLEGIEDFVEDPVEFKEEAFGEVETYGVAFTPLFLSIGLWVGALMLYVVLYYDQRHRFGILDHENNNKILQNCIYLGIGAVEGLLTGIVLKGLLGFNVVNMGQYLFECILTGMTFTMIMQFLIRNFGDIGKFLALIILVLQLAASGGTFPVETIDKGFQAFTNWLPMTYTVRIFKDSLIKTDSSLIGRSTVVVLLILIVLFVFNLVIEFIKLRNSEQIEESEK